MRSGMRARAAAAPTSTAKPIIRRRRPAVGDEHGALDAQQRRATQPFVVQAPPDALDARAHEEVADRTPWRSPELGLEHARTWRSDRPSKNFMTTLPTDASQTTTSAGWWRQVPPLDVADEPELAGRPAGRSPPAPGRSPLPPSSPIDSSATVGSGTPSTRLRVERPHVGVLGEVATGRVGGRPDVQEHERAVVGDQLDGERRPVHARQPPQVHDRRCHAGPGVTGRTRPRPPAPRGSGACTR